MYSAHRSCAVQHREQRAEAGTAEDQRGVGVDPDLDLVRGALNDGRVRHQTRMLRWVMDLGSWGTHGVSLRASGECQRAIHSLRQGRQRGTI